MLEEGCGRGIQATLTHSFEHFLYSEPRREKMHEIILFCNVVLYFSETDVFSVYDIKLNKALLNLESINNTGCPDINRIVYITDLK